MFVVFAICVSQTTVYFVCVLAGIIARSSRNLFMYANICVLLNALDRSRPYTVIFLLCREKSCHTNRPVPLPFLILIFISSSKEIWPTAAKINHRPIVEHFAFVSNLRSSMIFRRLRTFSMILNTSDVFGVYSSTSSKFDGKLPNTSTCKETWNEMKEAKKLEITF